MLSEVRSVTLGVSNLDRALAFYGQGLGFEPLARGPIPAAAGEAWRLPPELDGEVAQLAVNGAPQGQLRLMSFNSPGRPVWNSANRLAGDGFYAVNLRARDLPLLMPQLHARGASGPDQPQRWQVSEEVEVWDSISFDPDGIALDIFSYIRGGDLRGPLDTEVSVVQTVAIATHDVQRCVDFYGCLGFEVLFDLRLEGLEELLHVPPGISIHNVNMMKDGSVVPGRVECFRYHGADLPAAQPLANQARPPNLGILAITLESDDLEGESELVLQAGGQQLCKPVQVELPSYGAVHLQSFLGPDGEMLEILQR